MTDIEQLWCKIKKKNHSVRQLMTYFLLCECDMFIS